MSKYDALTKYLEAQPGTEVPMAFSEMARIVGMERLPRSAVLYRMWWSNNTSNHVHAKAWVDAGFETTKVDMEKQTLVFKRVGNNSHRPGMAETAMEFKSDKIVGGKKPRRHPAFGALKGTFTIEPGYDLTRPVYTDEEWAEIEKEMEADWDVIAEGMGKGK